MVSYREAHLAVKGADMKQLLVALLCLLAFPAQAFIAQNDMRVQPEGPRSFAVPYRGGMSASSDYWCAAGDFVIRGLRQNPSTRIYRLTPPPVRKAGVSFSLDSAGAVASGMTVFGAKDIGIAASMAQQYCTSLKQDFPFGR